MGQEVTVSGIRLSLYGLEKDSLLSVRLKVNSCMHRIIRKCQKGSHFVQNIRIHS